MRRAAKRDENERVLINTAMKLGWLFWKLDTPVDWLGLFRGHWYPIEIKGPRGRLTWIQRHIATAALDQKAPFIIWRTLEDVERSSK